MLKFIITTALTGIISRAQVSENRKIGDFSKIEVESGIELFYMESDENSIRVEGDSKYGLDSVITETDGKTLRIYHVKRNKKQRFRLSIILISSRLNVEEISCKFNFVQKYDYYLSFS